MEEHHDEAGECGRDSSGRDGQVHQRLARNRHPGSGGRDLGAGTVGAEFPPWIRAANAIAMHAAARERATTMHTQIVVSYELTTGRPVEDEVLSQDLDLVWGRADKCTNSTAYHWFFSSDLTVFVLERKRPTATRDVLECLSVSIVRSLHTVASSGASGPFDAVHVRVFYPAQTPGGPNGERPAELSSGVIAADATLAPFPVVVVCNPINIGPEYYRWLGLALAPFGYVIATVSWLSPGPGAMVVQAGGPLASMGSTGDQAPGVEIIANAVGELDSGTGPLAGLVDVSRIGVIGHSAGGTMALGAADHRFHPNVGAVVALSAHNAVGVPFGSGAGTVMRTTPTDCPVLLIGGSVDGVIDQSRFRYDTPPGAPWDPVRRTFDEAFTSSRGDCVLAMVEGANHFSFADPDDDPSAGRPFLDYPSTAPGPIIRAHTASLVGAFLDTHLRHRHAADEEFHELLASPLIASWRAR